MAANATFNQLDLRAEVAEGLAVFFLVLAGGAAILTRQADVAVALAFGFTITVLIYALGHVSGAHFNPAITLAFAITGHFPWNRVARYMVAQIVGALAASLVLRGWLGGLERVTTKIAPNISLMSAIQIEAIGTFLLGFVIIAVATDRRAARGLAGVAIGLTVALNALWSGPLTGAGTNPARSLGPALVDGQFAHLGLYLVVPLVGASLGMLTYEWLRPGKRPEPGEVLGALGPVNDERGAT